MRKTSFLCDVSKKYQRKEHVWGFKLEMEGKRVTKVTAIDPDEADVHLSASFIDELLVCVTELRAALAAEQNKQV